MLKTTKHPAGNLKEMKYVIPNMPQRTTHNKHFLCFGVKPLPQNAWNMREIAICAECGEQGWKFKALSPERVN